MNKFLTEEQLKILVAKEEERLHVGGKVFRERHDEIMQMAESLGLPYGYREDGSSRDNFAAEK